MKIDLCQNIYLLKKYEIKILYTPVSYTDVLYVILKKVFFQLCAKKNSKKIFLLQLEPVGFYALY